MRRFSIRDLFWLTLFVGLVLGWWVDRRQWVKERNEAQRDVRQWQSYAANLKEFLADEGYAIEMDGQFIRTIEGPRER